MMLNLLGPSAVGKTFFLKKFMDAIPDISISVPIVVFGDTGDEYHYRSASDSWVHKKRGKKWAGTKEEKDPFNNLVLMMVDTEHVWIVDVMRYFNGLWKDVLQAHAYTGGGIAFIVPYYTGKLGMQFRLERCERIGKQMSSYWYEEKNCFAESIGRVNMCKKHFEPAGIPCHFVEMDHARTKFSVVRDLMTEYISMSVEEWYD